jgi:sugar/nucleoside kinase (ribokinase family)
MKRVFVLGEVLCDLFPPRAGLPAAAAAYLVPHPGGAPANCAAQLARLGTPTELVTAVGSDPLGARALAALRADGVGTGHVRTRPRTRTGLTLVEVDDSGERRFTPWREGSADGSLRAEELPADALVRASALVHGTVSLRRDPARAATRRAARLVREGGGLIVVDVNLRPQMYADREVMLRHARAAARRAHVVKATIDEARAIVGRRAQPAALLRALLADGAALVALTDGERPAWLATASATTRVSPPAVATVDATGAGDAFLGALVADLVRGGGTPATVRAAPAPLLERLLARAAYAGARATTKLGATSAMPRRLPGRAPVLPAAAG